MSAATRTTHPADTVYRDATFTRDTRDQLAVIHDALRTSEIYQHVDADALADVIRRWDGNAATEFVDDEHGRYFTRAAMPTPPIEVDMLSRLADAVEGSNRLTAVVVQGITHGLGDLGVRLEKLERGEAA